MIFLRFLFATCVIFTHSFDLLLQNNTESIMQLSNKQLNASYVGLYGFFIISGFLIYESFQNSARVTSFMWKRFLRLIPGLFVVSILTVVFCGFILTNLSFTSFFLSKEPFLYIIKNSTLLHKLEWFLPGVFENNPNKGTINGSIWTICYEAFFYICLASLFFFKKLNNRFLFVGLFFISIVLKYPLSNYKWLYIPYTTIGIYHMFTFAQFFLAGMILNTFKNIFHNERRNFYIFLASLVLFVFSIMLKQVQISAVVLLPLFVISAAHIKGKLNFFGKYGDISYGIYIYSFAVQQTLIFYNPQIEPLILFLYAFPISVVFGILSWHFVEKKALSLKKLI